MTTKVGSPPGPPPSSRAGTDVGEALPQPWSDAQTTIEEIKASIQAFNAERDWGRYHSPRNLAMALSVEANELLELYLWSADGGPQPPVASREPNVAAEAADVLITLLNFADRAGIDLAAAVEAKLKRNGEKYPVEQARGRLEKAAELAARPADEG